MFDLCVGRIGLLPSGSLRIMSPAKEDEGLYTCTARNQLGSYSLSSWVQIKGEIVNSPALTLPVYLCVCPTL